MGKVVFSIIVISLFIIGSCSNEIEEGPELEKNVEIIESEIHELNDQTSLLNVSEMINVKDSYLVFSDEDPEAAFKVFSLPDLTYLYGWGGQGGGPEEFRVLPISEMFSHPEGFAIYDVGSQRIKVYSVMNDSIEEKSNGELTYDGQTNVHTQVNYLFDDVYIAEYGKEPADDDFEFIALQVDNEDPMFKFGQYPDTDSEGFERYFEFFKTTASSKSGDKIASFYLYHNLIKIFDSSGSLVDSVEVQDDTLEEMEITQGSFQYRTLEVATDDYLYALGIYKDREELSENMEEINTYFEIWDWDGNQVYRAQFDRPIHNFTVLESENKIYGYSSIDTGRVFEYTYKDMKLH